MEVLLPYPVINIEQLPPESSLPMRLGTFSDDLSFKRADYVAGLLKAAGHDVEIISFEERSAEVDSEEISTNVLDRALLSGSIHLAVYSLKDVPAVLPEGLVLAAVPPREDPLDAFIAHPESGISSLKDLPEGATIAAPSARQRALLKAWRSDLNIVSAGRDIPAQLGLLDESNPRQGGWYGLILAAGKLNRLGLQDRITEKISTDIMLPAVGQGALGIVTTTKNREQMALLLNDVNAAVLTTVERAVLQRLGVGSGAPVGVLAQPIGDMVKVSAVVAAVDGSKTLQEAFAGPLEQGAHLGESLADRLLALGAEALLRGEDSGHTV